MRVQGKKKESQKISNKVLVAVGSKKQKKKKKYNIPEVKGADEVIHSDIRRTPEGRSMIMLLVQNLYEVDQHVHPRAPVFDSDGRCRLKFEGASMFTWEAILEEAPAAMESM